MRLSWKMLVTVHPVSLTGGTILLVALLCMIGVPLLDLIELKTYDLRLLSRASLQPSPAIVLALVDEKSLHTEGRWPWPRATLARLIDLLSQDGARVIGFDIGFLEPDDNSHLALLQQVRQQIAALESPPSALLDFLDASAQRADNDRLLAEAMRRSSAAVVLGYFFHMSARELNYQMAPEDIERQLQQLQTSRYPVLALQGQAVQPPPFFHAYAPESNLPLFTDAAAGSGYFSLKSDPDGVIRWMLLMLQGGEDLYPPLAVVAAWHYLGKPSLAVHAGPYGVEGVQLGTQFLPTDHTGQFLINYLGPPRTFPHFSISDILHGAFAPGTFTNKIVLVGATATGTYDLRSTPLSPVYPGVEIHATVLDNILTQRFLTRPAWATLSELGAILVLGVCLGIALPRLGALQGLGCALLLGLAYLSLVHWLFVHLELWLNVVYPLLSLMSNYTVLTVYAYISVERQRKHIKGAFEHYVSPDVVNEIVRYPEKLNLGGERRVLTVLFSDIQNFTGISESMESPKLVELLNEYLTAMTNIVLHHRGTLDKYIGDAIMAFYGAPIALPHHPLLACYTALDMLAELDKLRMSWADRKLPQIRMRIGINTGDMIVGNMDSDKHFDYTVMGDTVNLASRLEGLNKAYGTSVLISETIADLVAEHCILREIDMAQVVGRKQPVRIYTLLGRVGTMHAAAQTQAYSAYAAGLAAYRQQDWDGAIQQFQHALSLWPDDTPSHTMLYRCHIYQQAPPPAEWDGVFEHLHK